MGRHPRGSCLSRREPGQLIDAQFLLYGRDAGDHMLETVFPEQLVLLLLEGIAQRIVLLSSRSPWNAGKSMVSSRAAWGRYMRMNCRRQCESRRRSSEFFRAWDRRAGARRR